MSESERLRAQADVLIEEAYRQERQKCPDPFYWDCLLPNYEAASKAADLRLRAARIEKGHELTWDEKVAALAAGVH